MHAMVLRQPGQPLALEQRPDPEPGAGEVRLKVLACAVCRTDLHVVDGELPHAKAPVVPGHEVVGVVDALGSGVTGEVHHVDAGYHTVGMVAVDSAAETAQLLQGLTGSASKG